MGAVKGQKQYEKWEAGGRLSRKEAILANCYQCNGFEDSREDCQGEKSCPIYAVSHYSGFKERRTGVTRNLTAFKRGVKR